MRDRIISHYDVSSHNSCTRTTMFHSYKIAFSIIEQYNTKWGEKSVRGIADKNRRVTGAKDWFGGCRSMSWWRALRNYLHKWIWFWRLNLGYWIYRQLDFNGCFLNNGDKNQMWYNDMILRKMSIFLDCKLSSMSLGKVGTNLPFGIRVSGMFCFIAYIHKTWIPWYH